MKHLRFTLSILLTLLLAPLLPIAGDGPAIAQQGKRAVRVQGRNTADSRQRVALVIGNSEYRNISALRNPRNDARDMAAALERSGFQVTLLLNGSRKRMNKAIRSFGEKLRKGGVGLFFYAGHGVQLDGVNYLIPIGADIQSEDEVEDEAVSANRVMRKMKSAGNELNMVFLDACRNNPYKGAFRSTGRGLAAVMNAPKGSLISYATGAGNVAADGKGRNGTYTKNLLTAINTPNLELSQMMKQVRTGVQRDTNDEQTPYELSSLTGNFYFQGGPKTAWKQPVDESRPPPQAPQSINAEETLWKTIENSTDSEDYQDYLRAYPNGRFAVVARIKLRRLNKSRKRDADEQRRLAGERRRVAAEKNNLAEERRRRIEERRRQAAIRRDAAGRTRRKPLTGMNAGCFTVESSKGWQSFNLPPGPVRVESITGRWSVDYRNHSSVGPEGHQGRAAKKLAPYAQYKFDRSFPFGALLVGEEKTRYRHVRGKSGLPFRGNRILMRINDQDRALGDNGGRLRVCFKSIPDPGKTKPPSLLPQAAIRRDAGRRAWRDPVTGMQFVYVPGGSFRMGCHAKAGVCQYNEKPARTVRLKGFWLGKHEVTQGQWKRIMGSNPSHFKKGDNYPVEKVSWNDARRFIGRLNRRSSAKFRLPSEAQWEYACRSGGRPVTFGTGNDRTSSAHANFNKNQGIKTTPVGKFPANALGLKDMSGNVLEWVQDRYTKYNNVGTDNPIYQRSGNFRVMRGGNWFQASIHMRCTRRHVFNPANGTLLLGFRLLRIR